MLDAGANVAISAIGSAHILLAYILVSFPAELGRFAVSPSGVPYQIINLIGGAFACAGAFATENPGSYPLGVLEGIWALIALTALLRIFYGRSKKDKGATPAAAPRNPTDDPAAAEASAA